MTRTSTPFSISAARLHRLLPSELERMAESMSTSGVAAKILQAFSEYLSLLKKPKAVELDDVTRITLQLSTTGLWKVVRPEMFLKNISAHVDELVLAQLCDALNVKLESIVAGRPAGDAKQHDPPLQQDNRAPKIFTQRLVTTRVLAAALAEQHQLTKKQGLEMMEDLIAMITKHLNKGERVKIAGLGILQVRKRAARKGRNPATGKKLQIKPSKTIAFRPSKELKKEVG